MERSQTEVRRAGARAHGQFRPRSKRCLSKSTSAKLGQWQRGGFVRVVCVLRGDATRRRRSGQEPAYAICFGSRLALRADGVSRFSQADVWEMEREFAALCALQEFCCSADLVVCRCGVREEPVGFCEDVRHELLELSGVCSAHIAGRDCGQDVLF